MLQRIVDALRYRRIFRRARKDDLTRALGIVLYHLGLSLRGTSSVLQYFDGASHESVRKWYRRAEGLFPPLQPKERRAIAVDETKIKVNGKWVYLWGAIDIDSWEILSVWISQGRSGFEALQFMRKVMKHCSNKPIVYVNGAHWYKWALQRLGLQRCHRTFGPRNPIEQWFGILKQRIKRFYKRWPGNTDIKTANNWIRTFVSMYQFIGGLS